MKETIVEALPNCDVCGETAHYDAKTTFGPWANLCEVHFKAHTTQQLGMGFGQKLILATK